MTFARPSDVTVRKALLNRVGKTEVSTNHSVELCSFGNSDGTVPFADPKIAEVPVPRLSNVVILAGKLMVENTFAPLLAGTAPPILSQGFSELDALRSDDSAIKHALRYLRSDAQITERDRIADRVDELLEMYRDEESGRVFSVDSLKGLVSFLESCPALRLPSLTITPDGDFYASWKQGLERVFGVQFCNSHSVRYVVFAPNSNHIGRVDRSSGSTSADALMKNVAGFNVLSWAGT